MKTFEEAEAFERYLQQKGLETHGVFELYFCETCALNTCIEANQVVIPKTICCWNCRSNAEHCDKVIVVG